MPVAAPPARLNAARTHFGLRRSRGLLLAGVLGLGLAAVAIWQLPMPLAAAIDVVAAMPARESAEVTVPAAAPGAVTRQPAPGTPAPPAAVTPAWAAGASDLLAVAGSTSSELDGRLMRIYGLVASADAASALDEARQLAAAFPEFGLAQMIYADLLAATTSPTRVFAAPSTPLPQVAAARLRELLAEARARVVAAGQRPAPGLVPAQFVRLDPKVRHAIAVDVSRSRVYVLENTPGGLVVKRDYYASVGKLGMSKQVEGDLRTPLGVYFVTGRVPTARLAERYGAAALPLNYPNQYDQLKGRTGSGIWLHGVEPHLFTRAPLATDGCVALSNPDLVEMDRFIERQSTPVLIAERLQWVDAPTAARQNEGFLRTFDAWRAARERADLVAQARFYADPLDSAEGFAATKPTVDRRVAPAGSSVIAPVSMLAWHDQGNVVVVDLPREIDSCVARSRETPVLARGRRHLAGALRRHDRLIAVSSRTFPP